MQFSGTVEIAAPRDKVWEFVSDPMQMGLCGPGVEKVEQIDEDHFRATAKVSVGPVSARFTGDGEFTERVPPERAVGRARGKAPGSAVDGTAQMTLRDGDAEGTTVMDWTADQCRRVRQTTPWWRPASGRFRPSRTRSPLPIPSRARFLGR